MTHYDALPFEGAGSGAKREQGYMGGAGAPRKENASCASCASSSGSRQTPRPLASLMADIAERVARLSVSHRDPEHFHIQKSELAWELRAVARRMERAP